MRSKVFIPEEIINTIRYNHKLSQEQLIDVYQFSSAFKDKFGYSIEKIIKFETKKKCKEKFEGDLNTNFKLFVIRCFKMSCIRIVVEEAEDFNCEFYTINEYSFSCNDGLGAVNAPIDLERIFYEIDDKYVREILQKEEFKCREIDSLAHYAKMETAIEYILPQKKLLLNELYKTNDPVESKKSLLFDEFIPDIDSSSLPENQDFLDEFIKREGKVSELKNDYKKMIKSISFSKDTTVRKGYSLPTMWAHYGQKHKGVCLVFDQVILKRLFKDQFDNKYKSNPTQYGKLERPEFKKEENESSAEFFLKHAEELFFKKDSDWGSESEYRFVAVNTENVEEDGKCYLGGIDQALVAIVLGVDFNENYRCSIKSLRDSLPNKNIGLYQLSFDNGEFKLNEENGYNLFNYLIVEK